LVNSRLGLFSAAPSGFHPTGAPLLPKLRGHFAEFLNEGSLARLGFLTLPTCVGLRYGLSSSSLEAFLGSVGSASSLLVFAPRHHLGFSPGGFACQAPSWLGRTLPTVRCAYPPASPHRSYRPMRGIGFSTDFPSPTLLRLGLGPGLPWADEPSPGNLRLSAKRILTSFFAYSYRHSLFPALHRPSQTCFSAARNAPLPSGKCDVRG